MMLKKRLVLFVLLLAGWAAVAAPPDPADVSRRIGEQFLSTVPENYSPKGFRSVGEEVVTGYGKGQFIHYATVSLWLNAIRCAHLRGDKDQLKRLVGAFEPYYGEKAGILPKFKHVDFTIVGALPLEIARLTGDARAKALGLKYADMQWECPKPDDPPPPYNPMTFEERMSWWKQGYSDQTRLWIDDAYMITVLQSQAYLVTGDRKYIERAAKEMCLYLDRIQLKDGKDAGLFYHAPDVPYVWGRGDGWMAAGMPIVMKHLGKDSPHFAKILAGYRKMMAVLLARQNDDGMWNQLVGDAASWKETSCTAMFAYAFLEGVRHGWLDEAAYGPSARKAYAALCARLDEYGNLADVCCGTAKKDDHGYYLARSRVNGDPHGQATLLWLCGVLLEEKAGRPAAQFQVVRDHADCLYSCGEEAVFTVTGLTAGGAKATGGKVTWSLDSYNLGAPLKTGEADLAKANPFAVRGSLREPGFLRLQLKADGYKEPFNTCGWSVGYEPEKIRKASPSPADFDAFWAAGRAKLAKEVPIDVQIAPYPEKSSPDWNYHRISFATFGRRLYGFFSTPTDKSRAKFPARLQIASAGWGNWTNFQPGKKDMVYLWFSVYPFEPSWDWETDGTTQKYRQMNAACNRKWGRGGYERAGIAGRRDEYFFYSVALGIDRAVEWLAKHPLVDASDITYFGGSQSGGLGLYVVGLNHRFRKAVTTVPGLTDTMSHLVGRVSSWPRNWENAQTDEERAAIDRNLPYYDAANFASRVTCPIRLTVGFRDGTCFPPCIYAAYNEIRVKDKAIEHAVDSGHGMPDNVLGPMGAWLKVK